MSSSFTVGFKIFNKNTVFDQLANLLQYSHVGNLSNHLQQTSQHACLTAIPGFIVDTDCHQYLYCLNHSDATVKFETLAEAPTLARSTLS